MVPDNNARSVGYRNDVNRLILDALSPPFVILVVIFDEKYDNPKLLIRHGGNQRMLMSFSTWVVNSTTPEYKYLLEISSKLITFQVYRDFEPCVMDQSALVVRHVSLVLCTHKLYIPAKSMGMSSTLWVYRNYWWVYASYKKVYNSTYVTRDLLTKMYINFFNVRYRIYNLIFAA